MAKKLSETAKNFADNLKFYRNRVGLSQADVAQRFDVALTTVSGWETGKQPGFDSLGALAELYGVQVADFFAYREECPRVNISSEADFVAAVRALMESPYVWEVLTAEFEASAEEMPKLVIRLDCDHMFDDDPDSPAFMNRRQRSELNNALELLVQMYKLLKNGNLKPNMFKQVIDGAIKDLSNRR